MEKFIKFTSRTGKVSGMPESEYHKKESGLGHSNMVKIVKQSPYHYIAEEQAEPTASMQFGTAVHCAILEPQKFDEIYVPAKFGRTKAEQEKKDSLIKEGKILIDPEKYEAVLKIRKAVTANPIVGRILDGAETEVSFFSEIDNVQCKCRCDIFNEKLNIIADVKTTSSSASFDDFSRTVGKYGYHVQDALYRNIVSKVTGKYVSFIFIVVETAPPYACALFELEESATIEGEHFMHTAIEKFSIANALGKWDGYPSHIQRGVTLKPWDYLDD